MIMIKKGFSALLLFMLLMLVGSASAQPAGTPLTLSNGDTQTPAMPVTSLTGETTYYSGFVIGTVNSTNPTTFSFLLSFKDAVLTDSTAGIYSGTIISPSSSFAVTEAVGRKKSITTSGSIDSGTVTYRLTPDGRADIISVSGALTIWEGKNSKRRAVGNGTVEYGTDAEGAGTMWLNFF